MAQIIKIDFSKTKFNEDEIYKKKLIRIRDEIEDYLILSSVNEDDELAIALAAGRFATMQLTKLTGEDETRSFVNDCIETTLKNKNEYFN
jgi:hypothetical protein